MRGKKWLVLATVVTVILATLALEMPTLVRAVGSTDEGMAVFLEVLNRVRESYVEEVPADKLIQGALRGMVDSLGDPYSTYLTPQEFQDFQAGTNGTFGGVGIVITEEEGYIVVVAPIKGTPGDRAGIRPRDRIIRVDGRDIRGVDMDTAGQLMRGKAGTEVVLEIERGGKTFSVPITREIIEVNPVESKLLPEGYGYVRLTNFNEHAGQRLREALDQLSKQGMRGVILDLRGNPGGLLAQALEVAREFVPAGPVVYVEERQQKERRVLSSDLPRERWPLVVLVDGGSASAAEIVAGAVQDRKAGVLVGEKTFGKATVQDVFRLANGGAVKLTIGHYLTPNGRSINKQGITPDVVVPAPHYEGLGPLKVTRLLRPGKGGLDVAELQRRLQALGYNITKVDGIYGPETQEAVRHLQWDAALPASGVLDDATLAALNQRLSGEGVKDVQLEKAVQVLRGLLAKKAA
ncbi:MAG TPA: S41 family peptidase [Firmicutes bacterium]|nr:S41 family peptidase [Bacillota bacterium]